MSSMEAMDFGFLRKEPLPPKDHKVAVIGAGPSGLAAAGYLASQGYQVDVYDKLPQAGGLMTFGIPSHRIPADRIQAGVRQLSHRYGVNFHLKTKICCSAPLHEEEGDHFSCDIHGLGELVEDFDAVIICTGSWRSRKLCIEGEDLPGVFSGLEFLFPIRAARYDTSLVKVPQIKGRDIVVIGAGHSAVDVASSSIHLGAASLAMVYRRTAKEAPCGQYEIDQLVESGMQFMGNMTPVRFTGKDAVDGVECTRKNADGSTETVHLPCQIAVTAIGEIPTPPFAKELGLEKVRKGEVKWLNMTAIENVFVAGDVLTGPSKIGKAIYSGLMAARSLANWMDLKVLHREDEFTADGGPMMPPR